MSAHLGDVQARGFMVGVFASRDGVELGSVHGVTNFGPVEGRALAALIVQASVEAERMRDNTAEWDAVKDLFIDGNKK